VVMSHLHGMDCGYEYESLRRSCSGTIVLLKSAHSLLGLSLRSTSLGQGCYVAVTRKV
jgi:hypothetical protein